MSLEKCTQPALLEALLAHMDKAAETNGAAANGTDEKAAEGVSERDFFASVNMFYSDKETHEEQISGMPLVREGAGCQVLMSR